MDQQERRQHTRYLPPRGTLAVTSPDCKKVGQIRNISVGGVAFRYLSAATWRDDAQPGSEVNLDITLTGEDVFILRIPCRVVHDYEVGGPGLSEPLVAKRQCGMIFENPSPEVLGLLESLMERCVVPDRNQNN